MYVVVVYYVLHMCLSAANKDYFLTYLGRQLNYFIY